jgi:hypothetical protein
MFLDLRPARPARRSTHTQKSLYGSIDHPRPAQSAATSKAPVQRSDAGPRAGCLWINWLRSRCERSPNAATVFANVLSRLQAAILTAKLTAKGAGISEGRRRSAKTASLRRPLSCLILSRVYWVLAEAQQVAKRTWHARGASQRTPTCMPYRCVDPNGHMGQTSCLF